MISILDPQSLNFSTGSARSTNDSIEIVLLSTGKTVIGVRVGKGSRKRLARLNTANLEPSNLSWQPALMGFDTLTGLPVFDLAKLLGLESIGYSQEMQVLLDENSDGPAEFVIDQYQEVIKVPLNEIDVLPSLVERALLLPAVWAVWRRNERDLTVLVEPIHCITAQEWSKLYRGEE